MELDKKMQKAYYTFSDYLKEKFGEKVYKVTIDAGFSCPNRDGTISKGGCVFCDESGSFSKAHSSCLNIENQIRTGIKNLGERFGANMFFAYFQAFTNTYAPVEELKKIYNAAFCDERILGISIGTRPDCIDEKKLDLISTYKNPWLELGLQSTHNSTLKKINRGHDYECFLRAYKLAKERNINVCVHMILGLFDESKEMMLKSAKRLAYLGIDGIKLHMLTILEDAPLAKIYKDNPFVLFNMQEYCEIVCDFLELLPPTTTIHRLAGSGYSKTLVAPKWVNNKFETLNLIDKIFEQRKTRQASKFQSKCAN